MERISSLKYTRRPISNVSFSRSEIMTRYDSISTAGFVKKKGKNYKDRQNPLLAQRAKYNIIHEGKDVTPLQLIDNSYIRISDTMTAGLDLLAGGGSKTKIQSLDLSFSVVPSVRTSRAQSQVVKTYVTTSNMDDVMIDRTISTDVKEGTLTEEITRAPSPYYLPKVQSIVMCPDNFSVTLSETETIFWFDKPSLTCEKGTPEGNEIEISNDNYLFLTEGKGRNRKVINAEVQTQISLIQTRSTIAPKVVKKNNYAFASAWDMHETYESLDKPIPEEPDDEMVLYSTPSERYLRKRKIALQQKNLFYASHTEDKNQMEFEFIARNPNFHDSVVLTERVLAYNTYRFKQEQFRGEGSQVDPLRLDIEYNYRLELLWNFSCAQTVGRAVTGLSRNHTSPYLYAISYGKFNYSDVINGLICIWCIKNPEQPERLFKFDEPITSIRFSKRNPHWLAVGCYNGDVLILDISYNEKTVVGFCSNSKSMTFEPIWCARWLQGEEKTDLEYVMTCGQDGRINRYTRVETHDFLCSRMMTISRIEANIRGVYKSRLCKPYDIPIVRNPACLVLCPHPKMPDIYYVGTEDGSMHKCSTNYLNQHIDAFQAHNGAVYDMCFSKFCSKIFATSGADGAVRIWAEDINTPLITLTSDFGGAIQGICWSPNNSTIIAAINGSAIYIWDLRRKVYRYCSKSILSSGATLSLITFTKTSDVLLVGDTAGNVYVFTLNEVSIPAYYQGRELERAIRKTLRTYPELLKQLDKIGKLY